MLALLLLCLSTAAAWAQTMVIGSTAVPVVAPATSSYLVGPLYRSSATSTFDYSRYAYLYTPAELNIPPGSLITQLGWLKADANTISGNNRFEVRLGSTTLSALATGTTWGTLKPGTSVAYTSTTQQVNGAAGTYFTVTLNTPYLYTGGNLLVLTDWEQTGTATAVVNFVTNPAAGFGIGYADSDVLTDATALTTASYGNRRPTLQVTYMPATPCTTPPTAGTATATPASLCAGGQATLSLSGTTLGTGLTYQWQQSSNGTTFTDITGATFSTYTTTPLNTTTFYRAVVTCSGISATSNTTQVTVNAATYATLPIIEGFENTWIDVCGTRDAPNNSWRVNPTSGNNAWRRNDDGVSAGWTSPTLGAPTPVASQGTFSARFHSRNVTAGGIGTMDLYANLSQAGTKRLTFDYVNISGVTSNGGDSLTVHVSTDGGATFGPAVLRLGVITSFANQAVLLNTTSATSVIRFRARGDFGSSDIIVDNVRVESTSGCLSPAGLTISNITSGAATVTWVGTGSGTFRVEYGPQGFTPGQTPSAGTVISGITGSSVNLTGLTSSTAYQVYVTQNCGTTSSSVAGPVTFTTTVLGDDPCDAITLPLNSAGCTPVQATNTGATTTVPNGYANPPVTGCGTGTAPKDIWFTVRTNATGAGSTSISFETTGNPAGLLRMFTASSCSGPFTIVACGASGTTNTTLGVFTAAGLTPNTTYYVSVSGYGSFDTQGPFTVCATSATLCATVRSITTSNITGTGATLTFNASGGATSYTVVTTPLGGTPVTTTATTSPVTLTGLTPYTEYTVSITANCSGGTTSTPVTTTFVTNPYCISNLGGGPCGSSSIADVKILGTTLSNPNTTCNRNGTTTYTAYPATGSTTANLAPGATYQLSVTSTGAGTISAWIDYDQDGQLEATEWVQVTTAATANTAYTVSLAVPATAVPGTTLLRVRTRNGGSNAGGDACTNFASGETEDYFITIGGGACPTPTNLAITNLQARSATLTFTPSASASSYIVTVTPQGGATTTITPAPTGSPVNLPALDPSTTYTVTVASNCGGGLTSAVLTTTFTTPIAPPLNDDPCGATVLTVSGTTTP
ncbi:fibronectin type III domain-containing protein, partial [Hymenobacter sp. BT175]|uniref:fibronectin type III domain-containing protein n=1 Tax=Hymenobacter translucens TaxID=2886507 RepID=UPI001D0E15F2